MFGQIPSTISSHVDEQSPPTSDFHHFESFDTQAQQTFAASNALCALRHYQPSVVLEPTFPSNENEGGLHGLQTPFSGGPCRKTSWSVGPPWVEPTFTSEAPDQGGPWTFTAIDHSVNGNPCIQYPILANYFCQEYSVPPVASFPAMDQIATPPQFQRPTPPLETLFERPCNQAASSSPSGPASRSPADIGPKIESEFIGHSAIMMDPSGTARDRTSDVPYAKLIERALLEAEGNRLALKDIYKWIEQNTDKANNPEFKGWQNSVRHNLSMNGAFTKIPLPAACDKSQKGSMWLLEPSAKEHGIQSTTRYRRKDETKRFGRRFAINVHRERSGRRGRYASQKSAKRKRSRQMRQRSLSLRYTEGGQLLHGRSHCNLWEQQHPAPPYSFSASRTQPYLPSPPLQLSSPNDSYSGFKDGYASMPLRPTSPLAYTDF